MLKLKKPTAVLAIGAEVPLRLLLWQILVWTERAALRQVADQAARNLDGQTAFAGHNDSYRPYLRGTMQDRFGRHVALGTASGKRGYDFAYPLRGTACQIRHPARAISRVPATALAQDARK